MILPKYTAIAGLLAAFLFGVASAGAAEAIAKSALPVAGDPAAGKIESGLCKGCHGAAGISYVDLIPNLAGQDAGYTAKQLRDFQSGARTHQIMSAISRSVTGNEVADIAAYFAGLPVMQGDGSGGSPAAEKLYRYGDRARGIPACAGCHGNNGKSAVKEGYPVIGGQHAEYLRVQLYHFRGGDRSNSPGGMMNNAAGKLTDAEIDALAGYLSGL